MPQLQITVPFTLWPHLHCHYQHPYYFIPLQTVHTQKARRSLFREHIYSQKEIICWNNLSLFCCHLQEILFVNLEEPPALLGGQIRGAPSLVEPDGGFVPLRDEEVHAAAAALHSHLQSQRRTVTVPRDSPSDNRPDYSATVYHHKSLSSFQQPLQHFSQPTRRQAMF